MATHVSEVRVVEILQVFSTFWSGLRRFGNLQNTTKRERLMYFVRQVTLKAQEQFIKGTC